jgi:RNA polymerase sigma factor (sigma-70 family)
VENDTMRYNNEEKNIVGECLKNNRKAMNLLYMKYKDAMYSTCYRITGSNDDAADALQDGFISVFNNLEKFEGKSSLGAWIKTIIIRAAIKRISKDIHEEIIKIEGSVSYEIDDTLTGELLEKIILELSPGYRTIFNLIEIEGYKHEEVAGMLGISVGTSKSQLFKAKNQLKKKLQLLHENGNKL